MKIAMFTLLFFMSFRSDASSKCSIYELKGTVKVIDSQLQLFVAEKTLSEMKLPIFYTAGPSFSPYVNQYIFGEFVLDAEDAMSGVQILNVKKIQNVIPDPLNQNQATTMKKKGEISCPKN